MTNISSFFLQSHTAVSILIISIILLGLFLARTRITRRDRNKESNPTNAELHKLATTSTRPHQELEPQQGLVPQQLKKPVLAVLPIDYRSHDGFDQDSDHELTDDLKTLLGRSSIHKVVFFTQPLSTQALVKQGVDYVLQIAAQLADNKTQISAQLLDTKTSEEIYSAVYLQSPTASQSADINVSQLISRETLIPIITAEISKATDQGLDRFEVDSLINLAYNSFLFRGHDEQVFSETRPLVDQAVKLEPENAKALATRAVMVATAVAFGFSNDPEGDKAIAIHDANLAMQLSPTDAVVLHSRGWISSYFEGLRFGRPFLEKAVASAPENAHIRADYGFILLQCGQIKEAWESVEKAFMLSPFDPRQYIWEFFRGVILFAQKDFDKALKHLNISIASAAYPPPYVAKIFVLMSQGKGAEAEATLAELATRFHPRYGKADFLEYSAEYVKQTQLFNELQALANTWPDNPS